MLPFITALILTAKNTKHGLKERIQKLLRAEFIHTKCDQSHVKYRSIIRIVHLRYNPRYWDYIEASVCAIVVTMYFTSEPHWFLINKTIPHNVRSSMLLKLKSTAPKSV